MAETNEKNKYDCIKLENQVCFPLYACSKELVRKYRKPLKDLELTYTQYIVMMVLWEFGEMTEGELGKKLMLDSGTLAPLLKRLEKQGLVDRIRPEYNERMLLVSLTEKGEKLKEKASKVPEQMKSCLKLSPKELVQLKALLEKALVSMECE